MFTNYLKDVNYDLLIYSRWRTEERNIPRALRGRSVQRYRFRDPESWPKRDTLAGPLPFPVYAQPHEALPQQQPHWATGPRDGSSVVQCHQLGGETITSTILIIFTLFACVTEVLFRLFSFRNRHVFFCICTECKIIFIIFRTLCRTTRKFLIFYSNPSIKIISETSSHSPSLVFLPDCSRSVFA